MRLLVMALVLLATPAAFAQSAPSFDCAKASNAVERAICGDAELAQSDQTIAAAYAALLAKLDGPAKDHLAKDQVRWLDNRNRGCAAAGADIGDCLTWRYAIRMSRLAMLARGDYPFISEQAIIETGKIRRASYWIDAFYPRFDGGSADFAAVNRGFADAARKAGDKAIPDAAKIDDDLEQQWSYEQGFSLYRPSRHAVAVGIDYRSYTGGAHGYDATECSLIDLRTGKAVGPDAVFAPGDEWLKELVRLVRDDLKEQFLDRPGNDDALDPDNLARKLREPHRYLFRDDNVLVIFNTYEIGTYVAGPYDVEIPYDKLRSLIRADGPLGN